MTTGFGPCTNWPIRWMCDVDCMSPTATGDAVAFATETLWALSGRQFGTCSVKLRPCRRTCYDDQLPSGWYPWGGQTYPQPALIGGQWFNLVCGSCTSGCSCTELSEVLLPATVSAITEVKIDGVVIDPSGYRLDNGRILVRLGARWPWCNDLSRDDTQVGTWSVTALYGQEPPAGAAFAMGELACQYVRAVNGEDCRLPQGITQLARQGVTIQYPDITQLFKDGRTGLILADQFIASWNPNGLRRAGRTYSVDNPGPRRVGT